MKRVLNAGGEKADDKMIYVIISICALLVAHINM